MSRILLNILLSLPLVGAFAMFALGIVVIYRASRVLNLAHGAMATLPAYIAFSLAGAGIPMYVALPLSICSGVLLGIAIERLILRPLRGQSQTTQTVGTVAVLGLLLAAIAHTWGTAPLRAPGVFPAGSIPVAHSHIEYGEIGLMVASLLIGGAFTLLLRVTPIGLAMRGAADNRTAASLMGIDPNRMTMVAWALGGGLAATAGVMLAGVTNLHPYTLSRQVLPAFVAALIGGLGSLPGAIVGAIVVGVTQGAVAGIGPLGGQPGAAQLVLAALALLVMALRGKRLVGAGDLGGAKASGQPARMTTKFKWRWWYWFASIPLLLWPLLPVPDSLRGDANQAAIFVIIGTSIVILTGWVGQISLSQASFVGVAAFTTGLLVRGAGIPFPLNLPIAAGVAALTAVGLGLVALRVRGLYLAVATLIFGWMTDEYLFKSAWLVGRGGSSTIQSIVIGRPGSIPSFDLTQRKIFWFAAAAAAAIALTAAANLRDSRTGRAFFAVRGSELAAASLGINVTRTKLLAFGISGLLAGVAGNLIMIDQRTAVPDQFSFAASLFFLSIAVVGGLTRLGGVVIASIVFAGLNELFFRVPALGGMLDLVSSIALLGAVMSSAPQVRAFISKAIPRRSVAAPPAVPEVAEVRPHVAAPVGVAAAQPGAEVLALEHVVVRFGGLLATNDVSLSVSEREVVGLIGPNGAGKTTIFNAISGFVVPTSGVVRMFGKTVNDLPPDARAALGLSRTFQVLQLFNDVSVFENLLVATHLGSASRLLDDLFVTDRAVKADAEARERVNEVIDLMDLRSVAHVRAGDLPFGVLRLVEVGRCLVGGAKLLLLDEPASGLDERETDALGALLETLPARFGTSLLVVEHDVRFVTAISDRMYVLDQGALIANGVPDQIRTDPKVIAAYLGEPAEPEPLVREPVRTA